MKGLETLDVSYNKLTGLPGEIMLLENLKFFKFDGNEMSFPPPDVMMQDMQIVYKFLKGDESSSPPTPT